MLGMQGKELELELLSKGPGVEKTEENCVLKSSAFVLGSCMRVLPLKMSGMPAFS